MKRHEIRTLVRNQLILSTELCHIGLSNIGRVFSSKQLLAQLPSSTRSALSRLAKKRDAAFVGVVMSELAKASNGKILHLTGYCPHAKRIEDVFVFL